MGGFRHFEAVIVREFFRGVAPIFPPRFAPSIGGGASLIVSTTDKSTEQWLFLPGKGYSLGVCKMPFCELPQLVLYDIFDLIPFPELRHLHHVNRFLLVVMGDYMRRNVVLGFQQGVELRLLNHLFSGHNQVLASASIKYPTPPDPTAKIIVNCRDAGIRHLREIDEIRLRLPLLNGGTLVYSTPSQIASTYYRFPCYDFLIHINLVRKASSPSCGLYYQESVSLRFNVKEQEGGVILESVTLEVERLLRPGLAIGV